MYKNNNFDGLSKKDIKRIQEIVANIHAKSMREDLKDAKYVEGYMYGRRSVTKEIGDIADYLYNFATDLEEAKEQTYPTDEDVIAGIVFYADMLVELIQDIEQGE